MGSVKDLIRDDSPAGRLYQAPTATEFGRGAWRVSGRFSVGDLKGLIPHEVEIKDKAEALTMSTGAFFEWLAEHRPSIPTCYLGVLDKDGKVTTVDELVGKGDRSNVIIMKLAHVPETFCSGDLSNYREAISTGALQCGVADVESIFRHGFPLGSSTFEKIFKAVYGPEDGQKRYEKLATYDETVHALDELRALVARKIGTLTGLEKVLKSAGLNRIPNPGHVLQGIVYNSTSKFELAGDRDLSAEEERKFSGLDDEGYQNWAEFMFPNLARAQLDFCSPRRVLNIDGKAECVAYHRKPVVTDFACTVDENRLMIEADVDGVRWAIPSNKEVQRAVFRQAGVYAAINEAKSRAKDAGNVDGWRDYMPAVLAERKVDLREVTRHSCSLMGNAIGEVANRMLGKRVFDAPAIDSWVRDFLPYASKVEYGGI